MKIHTNELYSGDISNIAERVEGITLYVTGAGSRSHDRAYEIRLTGSSKCAPRNMPGEKAATYDEWGHFIARLFAIEPGAKIGHYKDAADFHEKTKNAFQLSLSLQTEYENMRPTPNSAAADADEIQRETDRLRNYYANEPNAC